MVKEAEAHAAEDKKKREAVDARNQLDGLVYQTEKTLGEHGRDARCRDQGRASRARSRRPKKALEQQDAEPMRKAARTTLTPASHKLAEAMYAKASQPGRAATDEARPAATGAAPGGKRRRTTSSMRTSRK